MRITTKGQVTIPQDIRERMGLLPHTEVEFLVEGNAVKIRRLTGGRGSSRGRSLVERLRGAGSVRLSTDEIMALTRR